jgi:hypothetical protein
MGLAGADLSARCPGPGAGHAFDFYKYQDFFFLNDQIDFVGMGSPVSGPNLPAQTLEMFGRQGFPLGPQGLIFVV